MHQRTYTENLGIDFSLNIVGSGANTTIIDGGGVITTIAIARNTHVTLSKVTVRNGAGYYGGGIANNGELTVNDSSVFGTNVVRVDARRICLD